MRAHVELDMNPGERSALKTLTAEEREAVVDDLVEQAREELEWVLARAAVEELVTAHPSLPTRHLPPSTQRSARHLVAVPSPTRPATPPPLPPALGGPATRQSKPIRRPPPRSWINR